MIPAQNNPENIEKYKWKRNKLKLYVPLYNTENGCFSGRYTHLTLIIAKGDCDKTFFSYGYDECKSSLLYSVSQKAIKTMLNIFQGICLEEHVS